MKDVKKRSLLTLLLTAAGVLGMAWVEGVLRPIYPIKSALKFVAFLGCTGLYALLAQERIPGFRHPSRRALIPAAILALGIVVFLLGGWLVLSPWLDLSAIPENLAVKEGITKETFPLAAIYITLCNSLLEEYFFRGFAFLTLYQSGHKRLAYGFSAFAFALYHISITSHWGAPGLILLMTVGLTIAGLLFNWLDRAGCILPSWLVHMGANLATNVVGLILFGL
ncbi:MAG: CPBP family intramembrane metalloprotease [Oscillibacter sp.]|nr:CPBP family intramembrane metalloprotease [Oscillibacter sp.]